MIYVITKQAGGWTRDIVTAFDSRADLMQYASDVLSCSSIVINSRDTIGDLCDKLGDQGMGRGSRYHRHVSRADAIEAIRDGARPFDCFNLARCYGGRDA